MKPTQGKATIPSEVFDLCDEDGRYALGHVLLVPGVGGRDAWAVMTDGRILTCRNVNAKLDAGVPVLVSKQECSRDAVFEVELSEATEGTVWKQVGVDKDSRFPRVMDAVRDACLAGETRSLVFLDAELLVQMQRALSPSDRCLRLMIGSDGEPVLVTGELGIGVIMPKSGNAKFRAAEVGIAEDIREELLSDYEASITEPAVEAAATVECWMIA
jgi:hypothetical protein